MDKQAKAKERAKKPPPGKAKTVKGKPPVNEDKFRGDGMNFKGKLVGLAEVNGPRGDNMCIEAIKKLKLHAVRMNKEIGEHKQKIVMNVNLKGIKLIDEKTQLVVHEHMINKVSYITHDPEDKRTFGYIVSVPSCPTGHQLFALKTEKTASTVTATLYELFQVVYKLRQEAQRKKATTPTAQAENDANNVSNGPAHDHAADGIYEEPAKCTPPLSKKPATPHYKVPRPQAAPAPPPPRQNKEAMREFKKDEDSTSVSSTDRMQYEVPAFDAEPIFGASFIAKAGRKDSTLSETGSVSSANVLRSDSISSSSSDALTQSGEHARTAAVVLSPVGDTFASSHEGIPTAGAKQSFSFDAAFPPISSPSNNADTTGGCFPESQSFQAAFPTDSSFGSKADTTGASFTENQSFQAAFPDDSEFGGKVDKTAVSFTENESFQAAFPTDFSFGSKANTTGASFTENRSFQAAFPNDSNFSGKADKTAASLTENESFQAAFPDDSSFGSKADTPAASFTENQSFQAAFPTDTSFGSKADATAVSFSESQPFEASFPPVTSSDTESSTPSGNLNANQTFGVAFPSDNGPSTTADAVSGNTKENQSIQAAFPKIYGPGVDAKKAHEPAFGAGFPDASITSTDTNKGGSFSESGSFETAFPVIPGPSSGAAHGDLTNQSLGFDDAFSSVEDDSAPTNQTAFQSQAFEAEFLPVSTTLTKTNESSSQPDQSEGFEGAFSPTTSTSVEAEVGSEKQATDVALSANVGFEADFPHLSSTAEASNSSATTFKTNFDDAFAPVTTEEGGVKIFTEPGLETSGKKDDKFSSEAFGVDSAFENLEQPTLKSGGKTEDLFASKDDPFSAFGEDINKKAPSGNDDPFAPSPATKGKPSGVSQFESAFGADSFLASPFEFKESSQSKTVNYVAKPDDSSTTANSGNSAGSFAWNDDFGESSKTTGEAVGENVPAIDTSLTPATESRPSTNLNLTKPTEVVPSVAQAAEISPTDSGSAVIANNHDSNNMSDNSSTKQDPFVEFKVDFGALKPATANTPQSSSGEWSDPKSDETDEERSQILRAVPLPTMSVTPVDEELSQVVGEVPELDANREERPTDLNSTETPTNKRERPLSPSAPPPLPPRPVATPPSLPPRPQTSPNMSTGVPALVGETPPLPPLPNINQTRKLPPALPPRVDLQSKSEEKTAKVVDNFTGFDPFGVQSTETTSDNDSTWASAWPTPDVKDSSQKAKENGFSKPDGGKSDPFGDDFFATFDFDNKPAAEVTSTPDESASVLPDPFTSTDSTDPFGSEDLFSQSPFASSKATRSSSIKNMFGSSLSDSFSTVLGNDPFSDTSDPFAGKGDLSGDPFTDSPEKKDIKLEEDPFTDSFA